MLLLLPLAILCFFLSFAAFILNACGVDVEQICPAIWILHPLVILLGATITYIVHRSFKPRSRCLADCCRLVPFAPLWIRLWMTLGLLIVGLCLLIVVASFLSHVPGTPEREPNGSYQLVEHGRLLRTLSEKEFHHYRAVQLQPFVAGWTASFWIMASTLASHYILKEFPADSFPSTLRASPRKPNPVN
jgi:hypothetical protein